MLVTGTVGVDGFHPGAYGSCCGDMLLDEMVICEWVASEIYFSCVAKNVLCY